MKLIIATMIMLEEVSVREGRLIIKAMGLKMMKIKCKGGGKMDYKKMILWIVVGLLVLGVVGCEKGYIKPTTENESINVTEGNNLVNVTEQEFPVRNADGSYNLGLDRIDQVDIEIYVEAPTMLPFDLFIGIQPENGEYKTKSMIASYNHKGDIGIEVNKSKIDIINRQLGSVNKSEDYLGCGGTSIISSIVKIDGTKDDKNITLYLESYSDCNIFGPWNIIYQNNIYISFSDKLNEALFDLVNAAEPKIFSSMIVSPNNNQNFSVDFSSIRDIDQETKERYHGLFEIIKIE